METCRSCKQSFSDGLFGQCSRCIKAKQTAQLHAAYPVRRMPDGYMRITWVVDEAPVLPTPPREEDWEYGPVDMDDGVVRWPSIVSPWRFRDCAAWTPSKSP